MLTVTPDNRTSTKALAQANRGVQLHRRPWSSLCRQSTPNHSDVSRIHRKRREVPCEVAPNLGLCCSFSTYV